MKAVGYIRVSTEDQAKLSFAAEGLANRSHKVSEAMRLAVLPAQVGQAWGEDSNGSEVWALYRAGTLKTVMLRRPTQPDSGLRVEKVTRLV